MKSYLGLLLLSIALIGCQGAYRVTPDVIRDQDAVHSTLANPRDRIDHIMLSSDRSIFFDNAGAYYDTAFHAIRGKLAESEADTTIALNSIKAAYVIRQDEPARTGSTVGIVIAVLLLVSLYFIIGLHGLSTI